MLIGLLILQPNFSSCLMMESSGRTITCLRNVKSLKLLYKIANVLCVAPILDFEKGVCVRSTLFDYYAFVVLFAVIGVSAYSLYGRFLVVYPALVTTHIFIDAAAYIMTTFANVYAIIKLSIWKNEDFKTFLVNLENFDKIINYSSIMSGKRNCAFYIEMLAYHLFLIAFCIYDAVVWVSTLGFSTYRTYIFRYFQYYQLMTLCFLIYNYVIVIKHRFGYVNDKLEISIKISNKISIITDVALKRRLASTIPEVNTIRDIANLYTTLCDIVEIFNKIFGFIILTLATNIILGLLLPLNLALVYSVPGNPHIEGVKYGAELAGLCLFWAAFYLVSKIPKYFLN